MKHIDFYEEMKVQERNKREAGAESTADLYRAVRNRLKRFCGTEKLPLAKVTAVLVSQFMASLRQERLCTNTVNSYTSNLRAMYHRACSANKLKKTDNPFEGIRLKQEDTAKRAVEVKAMEKIACMDLQEHPSEKQAADLGMFSFLACGMPYVDLVHLTSSNIRMDGKVLEYRRRKTGALIQVEMNAGMKLLVSKYAVPGTDRLFPVLPESASHEQYKASLAAHNKHLKEMGERLNLPVKLTSYVFRHTWASEAYHQHVEMSIISQALGHSTEKMTRHYLSRLDMETIAKANRKIVGKVENLMSNRCVYPYL